MGVIGGSDTRETKEGAAGGQLGPGTGLIGLYAREAAGGEQVGGEGDGEQTWDFMPKKRVTTQPHHQNARLGGRIINVRKSYDSFCIRSTLSSVRYLRSTNLLIRQG